MALIRPRGGDMGLPHYLRTGEMKGREKTRAELDDRIVLEGDLDIAEMIASQIQGNAEPFDHITVSFAETNLSIEKMQAYVSDLKGYMLAAFGPGEMYFYAEAHIPRWQKLDNKKDEKEHFRYPHIHIAVPKFNLVTGKRTSCFEKLDVGYGTDLTTWDIRIKAVQEHLNSKYGVKSPDESRRLNLMSEFEVIARRENKIDNPTFAGRTKAKLLEIQDRMIAERIESPEAFHAMLRTMGKVTMPTEKQKDKHISLRVPGEKQAIRLYASKYYQFTDEFIRLPTAAKQKMIRESAERQEARARLESGIGQPTPEKYEKALALNQLRALENRFIHMGKKFYKDEYRHLTVAEKLQKLNQLAAENFAEMKREYGYDHATGFMGIAQPLDVQLAAIARGGVSAATLNQSDRITTTRSNHHAKNLANLGNFDRFGPHPETSGRQQRVRELRGLDVDADALGTAMLLPSDARSHLALYQADADSGLRRGSDGRGRGGQLSAADAERLLAYQDALKDTRTGERLRGVYGRSFEELRDAGIRGSRIIEEAGVLLESLTFSESMFTAQKLETALLKNTADAEQYDAALLAVLTHPDLVIRTADGQTRYTTKQIVQIEAELVERAEAMASKKGEALSAATIAAFASKSMNKGQAESYALLCSDRQLAIVNGAAGTGKSFILKAMKEAYEREGFQVHGAILQGKTAQDLERDSGIKSQTMHSFLRDVANGTLKLNSRSVIVVDEAGMIGSDQMNKVLGIAKKSGARVRFVGDAAQLAAVEYGNAFTEVSKRCKEAGGLGSLTEIMRQKHEWQRQASEAFSRLDIETALTAYASRGFVNCSKSADQAENKIVREWAEERRKNPGKSMIVLAATNAERERMNKKMRDTLKGQGLLGDGFIIDTANGFREFSTGDRIMFTRNDKQLDTKNGTSGTISKIEGRVLVITTDDGQTVRMDTEKKQDIDHAYCITVHKSQGITVDMAFVLASARMAAQNLYVACTRHRFELRVEYSAQDFPPDLAATLDTATGKGGNVGRLVEHGAAPYEFDPDNKPSYYMTVEINGQEQTVWGKDLEKALKASNPQPGDLIHFGKVGNTDVVVTDDKSGGTVAAKRNAWAVKVIPPAEFEAIEQAAAFAALTSQVSGASKKEFSHQEGAPEWSEVRASDSVVAQHMADLQADKLIERTSHKAYFQELKDNLNADRVLDYLATMKGVVRERYTIAKDTDGRDRIQCGKRNLNVSDFLTKELRLDFKTQAMPILKAAYAQQNRSAFMTLKDMNSTAYARDVADRKDVHAKLSPIFKRYITHRNATLEAAIRELMAEKTAAVAAHKTTTQAGKDGIYRAGKSKADTRAEIKAFTEAQSTIERSMKADFKARRAALDTLKRRPNGELYKDFLEIQANTGNAKAEGEFRRVATTPDDLARLAALTGQRQEVIDWEITHARAVKEAAIREAAGPEVATEKAATLEPAAREAAPQEVPTVEPAVVEGPVQEVATPEGIDKLNAAEQEVHEQEMKQIEKEITKARSRNLGNER